MESSNSRENYPLDRALHYWRIQKELGIIHKKFSVLSFNVLAEQYTKPAYFPYCDPKFLEFPYRMTLASEMLSQANADIICLQEVDVFSDKEAKIGNPLNEYILKHYNVAFQPKWQRSTDGVLIGVKKGLFSIEKSYLIDFNARFKEEFVGSEQSTFYKGQIAIVVHAYSETLKESLVIVNTHLFYDVYYEDVQYFQIAEIIKEIENNYTEKDNIIICGDFNSLPESNVINLVLNNTQVDIIKSEWNKEYQIENMKKIKSFVEKNIRKFVFKNAYEILPLKRKEEKVGYTNYTENFKGDLDYILYPSSSKIALLEILKIPNEEFCGQSIALPNKNHSSDHVPICAIFGFCE